MKSLTSWRRFASVVLLLAGTAALLHARSVNEIVPPHAALTSFPASIDLWRGTEVPMSPETLAVLGPGQFLVRDYRRSPFEPYVNLYVAYFPSQKTGDTIHSPQNCLPGAGWTPLQAGHISLRRNDGTTITINRFIISRGIVRELVLYWYQAHDRVTPSEYWAKIYLVTDAIRMNRTDGALVRIVTPLGNGTEESAQVRALEFTHQVLPLLDSYIPR
jgi:EpsI family protein